MQFIFFCFSCVWTVDHFSNHDLLSDFCLNFFLNFFDLLNFFGMNLLWTVLIFRLNIFHLIFWFFCTWRSDFVVGFMQFQILFIFGFHELWYLMYYVSSHWVSHSKFLQIIVEQWWKVRMVEKIIIITLISKNFCNKRGSKRTQIFYLFNCLVICIFRNDHQWIDY